MVCSVCIIYPEVHLCSSLLSLAVNTVTKAAEGRKGLILSFPTRSQSITEGNQGGKERETRQEHWLLAPHWFLLSQLSYTAQAICLGIVPPTVGSGLGQPSHINHPSRQSLTNPSQAPVSWAVVLQLMFLLPREPHAMQT